MSRWALPALLLVFAVPARASAAFKAVKPVRFTVSSAATRLPVLARRTTLPGSLVPAVKGIALTVPSVRLAPRNPLVDDEDEDFPEAYQVYPMERIQSGYYTDEPRRKIGFLRKGESEFWDPSPWTPRRTIGFRVKGWTEFWDDGPPSL